MSVQQRIKQKQALKQSISKFLEQKFQISEFEKLAEAIKDQDITKKHLGVIGVHKLLNLQQPLPIYHIQGYGLASILIDFCRQDAYPQLQLKALQILIQLIGDNRHQDNQLLIPKIISFLVGLLNTENSELLQQANLLLLTIAKFDILSYNQLIFKEGGVRKLISLMENTSNQQLLSIICKTLSVICKTKPKFNTIQPVLRTFVKLITEQKITDPITMNFILEAIFLSTQDDKKVKPISRVTFLKKLLDNLSEANIVVVTNSLRILNNFISYSNCEVIGADLLPILERLLQKEQNQLRHLVFQTLSNLFSRDKSIILSSTFLNKLCQLLERKTISLASHIIPVFVSFIKNSEPYGTITPIFWKRVVGALAKLIKHWHQATTISNALQCFNSLWECGELLKKQNKNDCHTSMMQTQGFLKDIEKLHNHSSALVYAEVTKLLRHIESYKPPSSLQNYDRLS